jgi:hypothetical protein
VAQANTILKNLTFGKTFSQATRSKAGSTVKQMYALAQRIQPSDTHGGPCTHRASTTRTGREWQHQLRREAQVLLSAGYLKPVGEARNRAYVRA